MCWLRRKATFGNRHASTKLCIKMYELVRILVIRYDTMVIRQIARLARDRADFRSFRSIKLAVSGHSIYLSTFFREHKRSQILFDEDD